MPQLSVPIINIGPLGQVVKQGSAMGDVPKYDTTTWGAPAAPVYGNAGDSTVTG